MNHDLSLAVYALVPVASVWLVLLWLWQRRTSSRRLGIPAKALAGAVTMLLFFVPLGDLSLWERVFSFYPNPSLPMLGIVCAALWLRLFGLVVFQRADWDAIWIFGALAGSALYLHPLFFGAIDLYYWGWDRTVAAWTVGTLAVIFLACGSRLGVLLLAGLFAYAVTALESQNCWDYVIDPIYWLVSLGVLAVRAAVMCLRRTDGVTTQAQVVLAPARVRPAENHASLPEVESRRLEPMDERQRAHRSKRHRQIDQAKS